MKKHLALVLSLCSLSFTGRVSAQTPSEITGTIAVPPGTDTFVQKSSDDIALIFFVTNMIQLFTIIAGLYVVINVILAAFHLLSMSGDAAGYDKAKTQITNSVIGLLIIVMAYTLTGLVGLIFFGDATIFLDPKI